MSESDCLPPSTYPFASLFACPFAFLFFFFLPPCLPYFWLPLCLISNSLFASPFASLLPPFFAAPLASFLPPLFPSFCPPYSLLFWLLFSSFSSLPLCFHFDSSCLNFCLPFCLLYAFALTLLLPTLCFPFPLICCFPLVPALPPPYPLPTPCIPSSTSFLSFFSTLNFAFLPPFHFLFTYSLLHTLFSPLLAPHSLPHFTFLPFRTHVSICTLPLKEQQKF